MKRKITFMNMIGYACINFLGSGSQAVISAYLMFFYTSCCGISAAQAGLIFTAARLIDAIGNPIVGSISDNFGNTKLGKKFGRRRFFTLLGIPLTLIIYPILWTTGHSFTFYFVMEVIWEITFTLVLVTGTTLPAEMAETAADKTKLVSAKQYCGTFASAMATFFPAQFIAKMGKDNPKAYFYGGLTYAVIMAVSLVVFYFFTFERDASERETVETKSVSEEVKKIFVNIPSALQIRAFRLHSAMMLLIGIYKNLAAGVFTYFIVYCLGSTAVEAGMVTSLGTIISLAAVTIGIALCYNKGSLAAFKVSTLIVVITSIGYFALTKVDSSSSMFLPALVGLGILYYFGRAGLDYIPVFQLPFMADIDEAVTMQRREGIFTGTNGLLSKVAGAVESSCLGFVLGAFGFVETKIKAGQEVVAQPDSAINCILVFTVVVPAVLLAITYIAAKKLNLTKESHKLLVDEVNRIKAGGRKEDVTPEAKEAVERLTGFDYDKCFGNNNVGYHEKTVNA